MSALPIIGDPKAAATIYEDDGLWYADVTLSFDGETIECPSVMLVGCFDEAGARSAISPDALALAFRATFGDIEPTTTVEVKS